jgi:hypothetical protein
MDFILFTCIEAQKLIDKVLQSKLISDVGRAEIVQLYVESSPKHCEFDIINNPKTNF